MKKIKVHCMIERDIIIEVEDDATVGEIRDIAAEMIANDYEYFMDDWEIHEMELVC